MEITEHAGGVAHQGGALDEESRSEQEQDSSIILDYSWPVFHAFLEVRLSKK